MGGRGWEVGPYSWLGAGMAASRLCDFCEILASWRWIWWGVLSEFAENKNNCSACNAKSKSGRTKNFNVTLLTAIRAV